LSNTTESYANLVFKTMEALRWALANVNFETLLKVDDDSIVHVGRLWSWVHDELPREDPGAPPPSLLYAGRVFRNSQVVRANFTRNHLRHPDWFPASFLKWAVDESVYPLESYPPYCGGGGYILGVEASNRVVNEYNARYTPARIIPVEDAFIGVLARAQGIVPHDQLQFQEPTRGALQTREMYIDQILVHRVVEPFKAMRWLMLSSNCHAGRRACEEDRNRTHAITSQAPLASSPDTPALPDVLPPFDKDWISGSIPRAAADAITGSVPSYDRPHTDQSTAARSPRPRKRKKDRRRQWKKRRRANQG